MQLSLPVSHQASAATPLMRQYLEIKAEYQDALLFFRLGDFYELFYDDALTAARTLGLTLTSRNKGAADEVPMAGIPYHAASSYIQKLLEQGFKVALCEQMADPTKVKGIVPRAVVRVVSPGIVFDDAGLLPRQGHYLVAIERDAKGLFGLAVLDASTGEFRACEVTDAQSLLAELVRLDPREVLVGAGVSPLHPQLTATCPKASFRQSASCESSAAPGALLKSFLGKESVRVRELPPSVLLAAAQALAWAQTCEPGRPLPIGQLTLYTLSDTLLLDDAVGHLELVKTLAGEKKGSLLHEIDVTRTAKGARLLRQRLLSPLTSVASIEQRLDAVEFFVTQPTLREEVQRHLEQIADLERLAVKVRMERVGPKDLAALRRSLATLPSLHAHLDASPQQSHRTALEAPPTGPWIDLCTELHALLERALVDDPPVRLAEGVTFREGFHLPLDEVRTLARDGQQLMVQLEAALRTETQIPSLKVRYTRVFGWYLEVTRTHVHKAPSRWTRKQTIATGERFTCEELDRLADKLAHAEQRTLALEAELFHDLVQTVAREAKRLHAVAETLATWDVVSALAEVAHRHEYVRPQVDDSLTLSIEAGRHPVVERLAAAGRFVPNATVLDATLGQEEAARLWLLTGPNMAGKSTLMRQVAVIVILAQMGSFVPAKKAQIGVCDRVLTRVGASDNLAQGESTFMVEMKETANILQRATLRSLVVLDEIGRGTSTYDGLAIARAVVEHLDQRVGCRALCATHYHELTALPTTHPRCANWNVSAQEHRGELVFLHTLQPGAASRSYGVACARLGGLPEPVLQRAQTLLGELESALPNLLPSPKHVAPLASQAAVPLPYDPLAEKVREQLAQLDLDQLTPLAALLLVTELKKMLTQIS